MTFVKLFLKNFFIRKKWYYCEYSYKIINYVPNLSVKTERGEEISEIVLSKLLNHFLQGSMLYFAELNTFTTL